MMYALTIGWLLDLVLGDPAWLPHPVVYMGKWIAWGERRFNGGRHRKAKGALFALISVAGTFALSAALLHLLGGWGTAVSALLIFFCLAGRTLRSEVRDVFRMADIGVEEARRQVSRIVGRDTQELSLQECRTAALETLAENLSDGVVAPLFWLALLGVPGMLTYKMVNTLDSMIGYKTARYRDFGCWAAHIDDVANFIPARLTALLLFLSAHLLKGCHRRHLARFILHYGPQHASPNSGWPEAALAGILDCRFGGPHNYFGQLFPKPFIGQHDRPLTTADMQLSLRLALLSEVACVLFLLVCYFFRCR